MNLKCKIFQCIHPKALQNKLIKCPAIIDSG
jgi:hypothetical protein